MRPGWFLLLALWACYVTESTHALSIVPNGLRHSLSKRDASSPTNKIKIHDLHVETHIEYRFATTRISSRIANGANVSQEVFFNVVIPEKAFISGFKMMVDNKVYEAYVKEKDAAKREYTEAVSRGQTAAHIAASARDSGRFTVSVNVEPTKKVTFNLTYDELLTRRMGTYNLAINLDPGQVVRSMSVDVYIKENLNITVLRVPELRTGNEVDADENTAGNSLATIVRTSPTEAHVSFTPTAEQQKSLGQVGATGENSKKTLSGQFVVQYDVDRDPQAGDVMVSDGYFVHFYAPKNLTPLRKHAIFVLDVSGSMGYSKLDQLKEAMVTILDNLNEGDYFSIVEFSDNVKVWDVESISEVGRRGWGRSTCGPSSETSCDAESLAFGPALPATASYIDKAKEYVRRMTTIGGTNIHDALKVAVKVAHAGLAADNSSGLPGEEMRAPLIVFLTDGQATTASTEQILATVAERNRDPAVAVFSLAFGDDADLDFLKRLSLRNLGFARKIYQASDAALQLRDFYRQIASPLLTNVTFSYPQDKIVEEATTKTHFPTLFLGSELVVAGKLKNEVVTAETTGVNSFEVDVLGISRSGDTRRRRLFPYECREIPVNHTVTPVEKLWAYLTIKQLLETQDMRGSDVTVADGGNNTGSDSKQRALELALKYSFVTPLTSLVVIKPNASELAGGDARVEDDKYARSSSASGRSHLQGQHYPRGMSANVLSAPRRHSSQRYRHKMRLQPVFHSRADTAYDSGDGTEFEIPITESVTTALPEVPALILPDELDWLEAVKNDHEVTLPFGPSGTNMTYDLLPDQGTYLVHKNCTTKLGVDGYCHHLKDCPLNVIKHSVESYSVYFCTLENYAGVCCPRNLAKLLTDLTPKS